MKYLINSLFAYLIIAFVAISCGENPSPNLTISKNCKLSKVTESATGSNTITTFKYDNTNKILEILILVKLSNKEEKTIYTFTYNTAGQLATRKLVSPTRVSDYTFFYKSNGQIEKEKVTGLFTGDTQNYQDELKFEYNVAGKIIKMISNDLFRIYNYDSKGNLSSVQTEYFSTVQITTYQYDDKKSHLNLIQSGFPEEPNYQNMNNVLTFDFKRNGISAFSSKYEYVYNSKGLPTKYTVIGQNLNNSTAIFEYIDCE